MTDVVVFEDHLWRQFLPLTYVRSVTQLLCGCGSLLDRVDRLAGEPTSLWCRPDLAEVVAEDTRRTVNSPAKRPKLFLNGRGYWNRLPDCNDRPAVGVAGPTEAIACVWTNAALAARLTPTTLADPDALAAMLRGLPRHDVSADVSLFAWPWEIVLANERVLIQEASAMMPVHEGEVDTGSYLLRANQVRIERGARVKPCAVIDAEDGPVWIGAGVTISPHCYVQGPAFIGDDSLLQPGAVVHAGTTIGNRCKIGGEIEASIMQGYSNKQHDGFLGHSYIGSWVNIAADCINSDLKNTYGSVRVPINGRDVDTGEQFVGMLMGDYSKAGINVSFPTGAVVGFCSNVFRSLSPKFVPSFTWLDADDDRPFDLDRGLEIARKVMARRQRGLTPALEERFRRIAEEARRIETA